MAQNIAREEDPLFHRHRQSVYSQHGEDGLLRYFFQEIGLKKGTFLEVGGHDGIFLSNCRQLFEKGWSGIFIEADKQLFQKLQENYRHAPSIQTFHAHVTTQAPYSLDSFVKKAQHTACHFLSLDIDSYDLALWKSLKRIRPVCVCIEYDIAIPFDTRHECPPSTPQERHPLRNAALSIYEWASSQHYSLVAATATNLLFIDNHHIKGTIQTLTYGQFLDYGVRHFRDFIERYAFNHDGRLIALYQDRAFLRNVIAVPGTPYYMAQPIPKGFLFPLFGHKTLLSRCQRFCAVFLNRLAIMTRPWLWRDFFLCKRDKKTTSSPINPMKTHKHPHHASSH